MSIIGKEEQEIFLDGRKKWVSTTKMPLRDENNNIIGTFGISRDITEKKKSEIALREREKRCRVLFNSANDAVFVHGIKNGWSSARFDEANNMACKMLGYQREELLKLSPVDIYGGEIPDDILKINAKSTGEKQHIYNSVLITRKGKKIAVEINSRIFELNGEKKVLFIARDISERVLMEERFRQSQTMEAVGRLAGGVAHDFNNLLTAIIGYTEMLKIKIPPENDPEHYIEEVLKAANSAASLTQQLLTFSHKQF